jgi:asparagine synthase (glutamine-hydrolysing)
MCGIAGVFYAEPRRVDPVQLERLGDGLAHRGPDGRGVYEAPGIGLVHRRLAIIDPAGAAQPMANADRSVHVTFNGEIYNFRELRRGLESRGHRFRTQSDTEILLSMYEEHGEAMVSSLRGMFAFAIWDERKRRLFLARDRLGIKPLYYLRTEEAFWFSSEPYALVRAGACGAEVDPLSLENYFAYGMVMQPRSMYRGIGQLPPGHTLALEAGRRGEAPKRYWTLEFDPDPNPERDWIAEIREAVDDAVKAHLVADVPVGAFLSGGVDSGAVVASAARQTATPMQTFTIGFEEKQYDEAAFARTVAERYRTDHREETLRADALEWLDLQTRAYDEPLADVSAIPTLMIARTAARHVKVALSGDGGDEAFGGYSRYAIDLREDAVRRRLPRWFRRGVLAPLGKCWPQIDSLPRPLRLKNAFTNLALDPPDAYANTLKLVRLPLRHRLIAPQLGEVLRGERPQNAVIRAYRTAPADPLSSMIAADMAYVLPDDYLVKVDRASMYFGLEVRPPLLDHHLMELSARLPSSWKIRGGVTKWAFKQSQADRLPADTLYRPKQGFVIPVDEWLRPGMPLAGHFAEVVLSPNAAASRLIDQGVARQLFERHARGTARNGRILWAILVLARWADRYLKPGGAA